MAAYCLPRRGSADRSRSILLQGVCAPCIRSGLGQRRTDGRPIASERSGPQLSECVGLSRGGGGTSLPTDDAGVASPARMVARDRLDACHLVGPGRAAGWIAPGGLAPTEPAPPSRRGCPPLVCGGLSSSYGLDSRRSPSPSRARIHERSREWISKPPGALGRASRGSRNRLDSPRHPPRRREGSVRPGLGRCARGVWRPRRFLRSRDEGACGGPLNRVLSSCLLRCLRRFCRGESQGCPLAGNRGL